MKFYFIILSADTGKINYCAAGGFAEVKDCAVLVEAKCTDVECMNAAEPLPRRTNIYIFPRSEAVDHGLLRFELLLASRPKHIGQVQVWRRVDSEGNSGRHNVASEALMVELAGVAKCAC